MSIKYQTIDIFEAPVQAIVHGCNCFHTMGGGIARLIRDKFPDSYQADLNTAYASKDKLGLFSIGKVNSDPNVKYVINLYTQYGYGTDEVHLDYGALESGMTRVVSWAEGTDPKMSIGIPYGIGCGLAGGNWVRVKAILEKAFLNTTVSGIVCRKP